MSDLITSGLPSSFRESWKPSDRLSRPDAKANVQGFFRAPGSSFLGNDLTRGKSVAEPWDCPQPDTAWRDVLIQSGTGPGRLLVVKPNILERKWQLKQGGEYSFSLPLDLLIPISSHIIYSWTQFAKERECRLLLRNSQLKLIGERGESMWAKT